MGRMSLRNQIVPGSGLSLSGNGLLVLGNDLNDPKAPAQFKSNRELPTNAFNLYITGTGKLILGSATDAGAYKAQVTGDTLLNGALNMGGFVLNTTDSFSINFIPGITSQGSILVDKTGKMFITGYASSQVIINKLVVTTFIDASLGNSGLGGIDFRYGNLIFTKDAQNIDTSITSAGQPLRLQSPNTFPILLNATGSTLNVIIGRVTDNGHKLQVNGNLSCQHLVGDTVTPTIVAGTGAGTGPTVSVAGTDIGMTINVTTGTVPAAAAAVVTVNFAGTYGATPNVVLVPANAAAIALAANGVTWSATTTALVLTSQAALAATTAYVWKAVLIQ